LHQCQGECKAQGKCRGAARLVQITNQERTVNWGKFYYCQTAVLADREKGLIVEVQQQKISVADFLSGKY
jgi:hypothetical protein